MKNVRFIRKPALVILGLFVILQTALPVPLQSGYTGGHPRLFDDDPSLPSRTSAAILADIRSKFHSSGTILNRWLSDCSDIVDCKSTTSFTQLNNPGTAPTPMTRMDHADETGYGDARQAIYLFNLAVDITLQSTPNPSDYSDFISTFYNLNPSGLMSLAGSNDNDIIFPAADWDWGWSQAQIKAYLDEEGEKIGRENGDYDYNIFLKDRGASLTYLCRAFDLALGLQEVFFSSDTISKNRLAVIRDNLCRMASEFFFNRHLISGQIYGHSYRQPSLPTYPLGGDWKGSSYINYDFFADMGLVTAAIVLNTYSGYDEYAWGSRSALFSKCTWPKTWFEQSLANIRVGFDGLYASPIRHEQFASGGLLAGTLVDDSGTFGEGAHYGALILEHALMPTYRALSNFVISSNYNTSTTTPFYIVYNGTYHSHSTSFSNLMGLNTSMQANSWLDVLINYFLETQDPSGRIPYFEDSYTYIIPIPQLYLSDFSSYGFHMEQIFPYPSAPADMRASQLTRQVDTWIFDDRFVLGCLANDGLLDAIVNSIAVNPTTTPTNSYGAGTYASYRSGFGSNSLYLYVTADHGYHNFWSDYTWGGGDMDRSALLTWHHDQDDNGAFILVKDGIRVVPDAGGDEELYDPITDSDRVMDNRGRCANTILWHDGNTMYNGSDEGSTIYPRSEMTVKTRTSGPYTTRGITTNYIQTKGNYKNNNSGENPEQERTYVTIGDNVVIHLDRIDVSTITTHDEFSWNMFLSADPSDNIILSDNSGGYFKYKNEPKGTYVKSLFRLLSSYDIYKNPDIENHSNIMWNNEIATDYSLEHSDNIMRFVNKFSPLPGRAYDENMMYLGMHIFDDWNSGSQTDGMKISYQKYKEGDGWHALDGISFCYRNEESLNSPSSVWGRVVINRELRSDDPDNGGYDRHMFCYPGNYSYSTINIPALHTNLEAVATYHYTHNGVEYVQFVCIENDSPISGMSTLLHYDIDNDGDLENITDELASTYQNGDILIGTNIDVQYFLQSQKTSVKDDSGLPTKFALAKPYPNPFNAFTRINFDVPKTAPVTIKIYNVRGTLVRTIEDSEYQRGAYSTVWNGTNDSNMSVASGVYFIQMVSDKYVATQKTVLVQ